MATRAITVGAADTEPPEMDDKGTDTVARWPLRLNLFWRTFALLLLLLLCANLVLYLLLRTNVDAPRIDKVSQSLGTAIELVRSSVAATDDRGRLALVQPRAAPGGPRVVRSHSNEHVIGLVGANMDQHLLDNLRARLKPETGFASSVDGVGGLWISFQLGTDTYWLQVAESVDEFRAGKSWQIWLSAGLFALVGSALVALAVSRPTRRLASVADSFVHGRLRITHLDEDTGTSEIRTVTKGINAMAAQLAKIDQDRAVMLAGISHDLRTPLARLRLEMELSVTDSNARSHIAADIDQLDAIIDKFLDYARPSVGELQPVRLRDVVDASIHPHQDQGGITINVNIPADLTAMGDQVDISRIITNLLENANRYGKTPSAGHTFVDISATPRKDWVLLRVRDYGTGVTPEMLPDLAKPFFRGDAARTAAKGAGLGLAIVDKAVQRMGGALKLSVSDTGGLVAKILLRQAKNPNDG